MPNRVAFVLILSLSCLIADGSTTKRVWAQEVATAEVSDFQRGLNALQAGRNSDAVEAFRAAYAHDQNSAALLNLGIAYTNLGDPHDAVRSLNAYVEHADPTRDAQSIQAARAEIERLRAENGVVQLHLLPAGAQLKIDDQPITPDNDEVLVTPGQRHVNVSAIGYVPFDQTLDVQPGRFKLVIELKAIELAPTQPVGAPVEQTPAPEPARTQDDSNDEAEPTAANGCMLSQTCIGPVVALLGPPNLIGGGVHLRVGHYFGAGVDYQVLPNLNINPVTVGASLMSANARVYPFGGAFFLGGGFAYQSIRAQFHDGALGVAAKTGFPAASANIGFMGHDGFVLGADIGLLFPLGSTHVSVHDLGGAAATSGLTQQQIDSSRQQAQSRVGKVLNAMPVFLQVNLVRLGYMF